MTSVQERLHLTWPVMSSMAIPLRACGVAAFALASVALVLYPTEFQLQYSPIQSINAIPLLWLFALLMIVWMGLLFGLLWSTESVWTIAALVTCFGLVYFSFWTLRWPHGFTESWLQMQGSQVIRFTGQLQPASMNYGDWPGMAILGATLANLAGREITMLVRPVVLVAQIALSLCLFDLYHKLLGDTRAAALAVVLAIMANGYLARFHFHPFWFGPVLLVTGLILMVRIARQSPPRRNDSIVLLLVAGGLAFLHFYSGVLLISTAIAGYIIHKWRWLRLPPIAGFAPIVMVLVMLPALWQLYWNSRISDNIVTYLPALFAAVFSGELNELFGYLSAVGAKNVAGIPLWANVTRLGWLAGLYGVGLIFSMWVILARDRFSPELRVAATWGLAIAGTAAVAVLLIRGGEEFRRVLQYGSLLAAPIIIACLQKYMGTRKATVGLTLVLLVLAVPSFFLNGSLVSTKSYYPEQRAAGEFLAEVDDSQLPGERVTLFSAGAASIGWYYLPFATYVSGPLLDQATSNAEEYARSRNQKMASTFIAGGANNSTRVMWTDPRKLAQYQEWFGPDGAGYVLEPLFDMLEATTLTYDNGLVRLWSSN